MSKKKNEKLSRDSSVEDLNIALNELMGNKDDYWKKIRKRSNEIHEHVLNICDKDVLKEFMLCKASIALIKTNEERHIESGGNSSVEAVMLLKDIYGLIAIMDMHGILNVKI